MYSCCLTCHHELGSNEVLRTFPVGKRLAFSPDNGRLWAICPECGEWNLAPLEDRWEAMEECEEVHEAAREKGSAGALTLARADGIDLVRVGTADELPTMRYGTRLSRRQARYIRRRILERTADLLLLVGTAAAGAFLGGFNGLLAAIFVGVVARELVASLSNPVVTRVPTAEGGWTDVTRRELLDVRLVPHEPDGWHLRVRRGIELHGPDAIEAARLVLPLLTRSRTPDEDLRKALAYIEKKGRTAHRVFEAAARRRGRRRAARLAALEVHIRLALEILAGRDVEERADARDLAHLQIAWKHADELAGIQDEISFGMSVFGRLRDAAE